jgi:hypothetical protein
MQGASPSRGRAGAGMISRMNGPANPKRVWIEVDPASEPIAGVIHDGSGDGRAFAGWLELVALLEATRGAAPGRDSPPERS